MADDPVPRANHARYLVVLTLGAFGLPVLARALDALGAPRAPAGVSVLLLAVVLIIAVLIDRPRETLASDAARSDAAAAPRAAADAEESRARL